MLETPLIWFGGKRRLLNKIQPFIPKNFDNYYEPFLGGGSMFIYLASTGQLNHCQRIVVGDTNHYLIATYLCLQDASNAGYMPTMLWHLKTHINRHSRHYFNQQKRARYFNIPEIAANFIYLNRASFGGIYRENQDGLENITIRTEEPTWLHDSEYWKIHNLFKSFGDRLIIYPRSFHNIEDECLPGDFVYFDPPYLSFNRSDKRSVYNKNGFPDSEHLKLLALTKSLTDRRVLTMQSNSLTKDLFDWYVGYKIEKLAISYKVTQMSVKANKTHELLIMNYGQDNDILPELL